MDKNEKLVIEHFKYRGYKDIVHEPDGNIPPDILLDRHIAVEVRLLNQNYFEGTKAKGLEEDSIPLTDRVEKLIQSFGSPTFGASWFVSLGLRGIVWVHFTVLTYRLALLISNILRLEFHKLCVE